MKNNKLENSMYNFQKAIANQIGLELSLIRKEKGLSGCELAKKLNISQQQVSRYERGSCSINSSMLFLILFSLEINPIHFFETILLKVNKEFPNFNSFIHSNEDLFGKQNNYHYIFQQQKGIILSSLYEK